MTLQQFVPAITATAGLYLLGRSIGAIQAMAAAQLGEPSAASRIAQYAVDAIALLLPRLEAVTRTAWLLYEPPAATPTPRQLRASCSTRSCSLRAFSTFQRRSLLTVGRAARQRGATLGARCFCR